MKYSLNYFNKVGKIELVRLIFAAANVDYEDNFIENLTDSDTRLGIIPYLGVDDTKIPLISVVSRFLAREFNLAGKNNVEQAKADAIAQNVMLLIDTYYQNVYNIENMDDKKLGLKAFLNDDVENAAATIETLINMYSKGDYCIGDDLTYADLFVYEMVTNYFPKDKNYNNLYDRFPKIFNIRTKVEKHAKISNYLKTNPQYSKHIEMLF